MPQFFHFSTNRVHPCFHTPKPLLPPYLDLPPHYSFPFIPHACSTPYLPVALFSQFHASANNYVYAHCVVISASCMVYPRHRAVFPRLLLPYRAYRSTQLKTRSEFMLHQRNMRPLSRDRPATLFIDWTVTFQV